MFITQSHICRLVHNQTKLHAAVEVSDALNFQSLFSRLIYVFSSILLSTGPFSITRCQEGNKMTIGKQHNKGIFFNFFIFLLYEHLDCQVFQGSLQSLDRSAWDRKTY